MARKRKHCSITSPWLLGCEKQRTAESRSAEQHNVQAFHSEHMVIVDSNVRVSHSHCYPLRFCFVCALFVWIFVTLVVVHIRLQLFGIRTVISKGSDDCRLRYMHPSSQLARMRFGSIVCRTKINTTLCSFD